MEGKILIRHEGVLQWKTLGRSVASIKVSDLEHQGWPHLVELGELLARQEVDQMTFRGGVPCRYPKCGWAIHSELHETDTAGPMSCLPLRTEGAAPQQEKGHCGKAIPWWQKPGGRMGREAGGSSLRLITQRGKHLLKNDEQQSFQWLILLLVDPVCGYSDTVTWREAAQPRGSQWASVKQPFSSTSDHFLSPTAICSSVNNDGILF